jgi:hypothetical protein
MLIIFGLAALALLTVIAIIFVLPIMIVVTVVRARRRQVAAVPTPSTDPDIVFAELVTSEWPDEARLLGPGLPPGRL